MNRVTLINYLIDKFNFSSYLEIGIDQGITFKQISCENKESVDPAKGLYSHAKPTHQMTSDEFFNSVEPVDKKWDVIFIDGLHESDQVDKDIRNSLRHLNPGGFVILHDCNPLTYERQIVPDPRNTSGPWNGDVWRSVARFRSGFKDYGCAVIDYDEGLGIISSRLDCDGFECPDELTYEYLESNREEVLNLVSKESTEMFLESIQ